jgi:alpha-L-fucosidase
MQLSRYRHAGRLNHLLMLIVAMLAAAMNGDDTSLPSPAPSPAQLAWHDMEMGALVHFGMNTFTDREWGDGKEDPKLFNPSELNAHQWVSALKAAGIKQLVFTAKHHDGFCLWPSAYTGHSVKNSPWRQGVNS